MNRIDSQDTESQSDSRELKSEKRWIGIYAVICLIILASAGISDAIDINTIGKAATPGIGDLIESVAWPLWTSFATCYASKPLTAIADSFYSNFVNMVLANPDLDNEMMNNIMLFFIHILEPVYAAIMLLLGVYVILMSGSLAGKKRAKSLVPVIIISMVAVLMSKYIIIAMLSASHSVAQWAIVMAVQSSPTAASASTFDEKTRILTKGTFSPLVEWSKDTWWAAGHWTPQASFIFLALPTVLLLAVMIVLAIRYLVLILFFAIFPMTLFLYSFKATRGIGRPLLEKTILWIFAQGAEGLMFAAVIFGLSAGGILLPVYSMAMQSGMIMAALLALMVAQPLMVLLFKDFLP